MINRRIAAGVLVSIFLLTAQMSFGQYRWSFYLAGGGMYYLGDLKETSLPNPATVKLAGNGGVRYQFTTRFSLMLNYHKGNLEGDDKYAVSPSKRNRNLRFTSKIDEISLRLRMNFIQEIPNRFTPYLHAGVGAFHFNPLHNGVPLQPLGTEGQYIEGGGYPAPYSLWQPVTPFGLGFSYRFGCRFGLKMEATYHFLFTDYLDDVSGAYPDRAALAATGGPAAVYYSDPNLTPDNRPFRGNPNRKDAWIDVTIGLVVHLGRCGLNNQSLYENCEELYEDLH